jgi:hypothetical protein
VRPFPCGGRSVASLIPLVLAVVLLSGCDATGPDGPASIEIDASRYLLGLVGDTVQVSATVRDEGGDRLPDAQVVWSSRDPQVVDVDAGGVVTALRNGSTWVVARSGDAADSARFTVDSPIGCAPVAQLAFPDTVDAVLTSEACTLGPRFAHTWILDVPAPTDVSVEMKSADVDAFLFIVDERGETVDGDDNGGEGTDARVYGDLDAGRYFIYVTTTTPGATGAYELSVYPGPPPSPCPARAPVTVPDTVVGAVGAGSCDYAGFYIDAWRLELAETTTITVRVDSDDLDPAVAVTDTTGAFLDFSGRGPGTAAWLETTLDPGSYDLWVGDEFNVGVAGTYTLAVRRGPSTVECPARGVVMPGDRVVGHLEAQDCFVAGGVAEGWELTLTDSAELAIALVADSVAPIVAVTDEGGSIVDAVLTDAFSAAGQLSFAPGSYRIWVLGDPSRESDYDLTLVDAAVVSGCPATDSLGVADSVRGTLAATDCALPDGRFVDVWSLRIDAAVTATIALTGDTLDAFLLVADSAGRWIAANDDVGNQPGASITRDLPPGRYDVWATSTAPGSVGGYALSTAVIASGAPVPPVSSADAAEPPAGAAGAAAVHGAGDGGPAPGGAIRGGGAGPGRWGVDGEGRGASPWQEAASRESAEIRPVPL